MFYKKQPMFIFLLSKINLYLSVINSSTIYCSQLHDSFYMLSIYTEKSFIYLSHLVFFEKLLSDSLEIYKNYELYNEERITYLDKIHKFLEDTLNNIDVIVRNPKHHSKLGENMKKSLLKATNFLEKQKHDCPAIRIYYQVAENLQEFIMKYCNEEYEFPIVDVYKKYLEDIVKILWDKQKYTDEIGLKAKELDSLLSSIHDIHSLKNEILNSYCDLMLKILKSDKSIEVKRPCKTALGLVEQHYKLKMPQPLEIGEAFPTTIRTMEYYKKNSYILKKNTISLIESLLNN